MTEYKKCTLNGTFIKPCKTLDSKFNDYGTKQKGLGFLQLTNLKSMSRSRDYAIYRMDSKDKGLVLNFCPWCGEKLHNEFEEDNA
jgi:hypothetical protein